MAKKALLLGASGLIGSDLLSLLLSASEYEQIVVLVRKSLAIKHQKIKEVITDFTNLEILKDLMPVDVVFCCIGTTRSKTPDLNEYRKIDHDIPVEIAKIAAESNTKQYHLITALGANSKSGNFYSKIKGETEDDIKKQNIPAIHIYQPSLLKGNRKENRPFEKVAIALSTLIDPLLLGSLKKYRSIKTSVIALAMYKKSLSHEEGIFTYPSDKIKELV